MAGVVVWVVGAIVVSKVLGVGVVGEGLGEVFGAAVLPSGTGEGCGAVVVMEDVGGAAVVSGRVGEDVSGAAVVSGKAGEGCGDGVAAEEPALVLPPTDKRVVF